MRILALRVALLAFLLTTTSCARTVYTNLHPQIDSPPPVVLHPPPKPLFWRHFFVFGLVPGKLVVDAEAYCVETGRIVRIETRRSFVQGLIASVAGYYFINVYSPYTGRVVCSHHEPESASHGGSAGRLAGREGEAAQRAGGIQELDPSTR